MYIHFWEFPEDKIFVLLEDSFRKKFFGTLIKNLGSRLELMKKMAVGYSTIKSWELAWHYRKNGNRDSQYCPIWAIKKLCKIYSEITNTRLKDILLKTEKNISAYRAHSGTRVVGSKLPIKIQPEVFRIIGHIVGDGSWTKGSSPYYVNSSTHLRESFRNDIKKVFGEVETYESFSNHVPRIYFPTAIIYILNHKFGVKFSGINTTPKEFLNLPKPFKKHLLQAFFDDEGYVHDSNVQICSLDRKLLEMLKEMLKTFHIETSETKPYQDYIKKDGSISRVFYFNIYSKSIQNFSSEISFVHPKKRSHLDLILKIKKRGKYPDPKKVRSTILAELKEKNMTAPELSLKTIITKRNLRKGYLYPLEKEGVIKRVGKKEGKGGATIWELN